MSCVRNARLRFRSIRLHPHHSHETPDLLATHGPVSLSKFANQLALAVMRPAGVNLVEIAHDLLIFAVELRARPQSIAIHLQQGALVTDPELGMILLNHGFSFRSIPSSTHFFSRNSFSMTNCPTLRSRRAWARSVCAASAFASDFEPNTSGKRSLILRDLAFLQCLQGDSRLELIRFAHPVGSPPDRLSPLCSGSALWILFFLLHGLLVGYATPKSYHLTTIPLSPNSGTTSHAP
jgi:hypothetical protein